MNGIGLESLQVGLFQCNAYILYDTDEGKAIVVDPGDEAEKILRFLDDYHLQVPYIILTHGHIDHIGGVKTLKEKTGAIVLLHKDDVFLYENVKLQASLFGLPVPETVKADRLLDNGQTIGTDTIQCKIVHTPGHSPGSICIYVNRMLFTGDTLFRRGIGRSDIWGGSYELLIRSLQFILFNFDEDIIVYPGHGPPTTIGQEKRDNPFIQEFIRGMLNEL